MKNRTYKFRGKSKKTGEWLYGDLIHNRGIVLVCPVGYTNPLTTWEDFVVEPETVGQMIQHYTNGHEVYEDDIVKIVNEDGDEIISKVGLRGLVEYPYDGYDYYYIETLEDMGFECHIIDNVFDNPELLTNNDL
nr:MAG TPA: YopX protein [Caudoviricetes sp.]